jgi:mRNA interferase RelE/StbE
VAWRVEFERHAKRELDALGAPTRARIVKALDRLAVDPRNASNVKVLHGGSYRLRVGDYRVIYALEDDLLVVLIVKVGHRRDVYRRT